MSAENRVAQSGADGGLCQGSLNELERSKGARLDDEKDRTADVEGKARNGAGGETHAEIFTGIDADQCLIVDHVDGANRAGQDISRR